MRFDVAYVDPPWRFRNRRLIRKDGGKARFGVGASGRYDTMPTEALMGLPLSEVMADPSILFCWGSYAMAQDALACMTAWGYRVSTIAFQWVKLNTGRARLKMWGRRGLMSALASRGLIGFLDWLTFFGIGHWSASNTEACWLGVRGSPALARVDKTISSVVYAPLSKHSAKPPGVAQRIVRMFGPDRRYLELFARIESPGSGMPGWTATGLEYDGLDVFDALRGLARMEAEREYTYRAIMAKGYSENAAPAQSGPAGLLC
jgi:N6-adenosine-specific RNA methylase IME4